MDLHSASRWTLVCSLQGLLLWCTWHSVTSSCVWKILHPPFDERRLNGLWYEHLQIIFFFNRDDCGSCQYKKKSMQFVLKLCKPYFSASSMLYIWLASCWFVMNVVFDWLLFDYIWRLYLISFLLTSYECYNWLASFWLVMNASLSLSSW